MNKTESIKEIICEQIRQYINSLNDTFPVVKVTLLQNSVYIEFNENALARDIIEVCVMLGTNNIYLLEYLEKEEKSLNISMDFLTLIKKLEEKGK